MTTVLTVHETDLADCFQLVLPVFVDARGSFVKTFHAPTLSARGLLVRFDEDFFSVSQKHVLRGFHFMTPPLHGVKLVYLIQGKVLDAILDLRRSSPTYRQYQCLELDADRGDALYLAAGIAHAFLTLSDTATVGYKTEFIHDPTHDAGIRWDSTPIYWPVNNPILSERDRNLPSLDQFLNPFS